MATIRLIPSTYYLSNSSYLSVSNTDNMYNNTDSTTYATVTNSRSSTSSYYIYLRGFNFDDIPSGAIINSFTIKLKAYESGGSTSSSYRPYLCNGTTTLTCSCSALSSSVQTLSFSGVSDSWDTISGYGSNFGIRINCRRASRNTTSYIYIYGAEILVDYTLPIERTITTSGVGCTVTPEGATVVYEGESFRLDITSITPGLTVLDNNEDVTNQLVETPATAEVNAVPASYNTSGSISGTYYQNAIGKGSDTDSTTGNNYCSSSGSSAYIDYSFDLSAIPSGATISSVVCKVKGHCESTSSSSEVATVQLYSGSTSKGDSVSFTSSSDAVVEVGSGASWTRAELDSLVLRFTIGYYGGNVSGATLTVAYEIESSGYNYYYLISNVAGDHTIVVTAGDVTTYNVNTTIKNGTLISPTVESKEVVEGSSYTINFKGDEGFSFNKMTINGVAVTPTETKTEGSATWSVSTNYSTYSSYSLDNINDGDTSTYWWSSNAQSTGYYVLVTFSTPVTLNSFSTYSSNSTDYPHSINELQVSSDGTNWTTIGNFTDTATSTFSNLSQENVLYVRIYANGSVDNWLVINEITMDYTVVGETTYSYTIPNILEDKQVVIIFGEDSSYKLEIKQNGSWTLVQKIYKKINGIWVEQTDLTTVFDINKNYVHEDA